METDEKKPFGVVHADCLEAMRKMPDNCVDAVVTDPPYGLNFMGKNWDHGVPGVEFWKEALRIAKPGAHLLSFGGTRTFHRIACAIEDAGWEIRDCIMWVYGSGFPKSMDISKAIDKKLGAKRAERGGFGDHEGTVDFGMKNRCPKCGKPYFSANPCTCPREDKVAITEEAKKWSGWGTCLKPAYEPVIMARKPLEGTVVDNVLKYGTGGINVDECRVPYEEGGSAATNPLVRELNGCKNNHGADKGSSWRITGEEGKVGHANLQGRFPANVIHDGSDEVVELFPDNVKGGTWNNTKGARHFENNGKPTEYTNKGSDNSVGSAARFFYTIKPECEPVIMARKPLEGTVADNVMKYGVGGINIDECRVPTDEVITTHLNSKEAQDNRTIYGKYSELETHQNPGQKLGRFPANIIHDGSDEVVEMFPDSTGANSSVKAGIKQNSMFSSNGTTLAYEKREETSTNAARFFYCAKASKSEKGKDNPHPTVKPLELMKYLIKMVAPKGALVLDPFMGSGSTGVAAVQIDRRFLGIEKEEEYFNYAKKRIESALPKS